MITSLAVIVPAVGVMFAAARRRRWAVKGGNSRGEVVGTLIARKRWTTAGVPTRVAPSSLVGQLVVTNWLEANGGFGVAEVEGETDAVAEENTPQTPAVEGEDGGWGAPTVSATEATATAPEAAAPEEPEEVQKSYDEFLAERAQQALGGFGKKEGRQVTSETPEGKAFRREALDDFYAGKVRYLSKSRMRS